MKVCKLQSTDSNGGIDIKTSRSSLPSLSIPRHMLRAIAVSQIPQAQRIRLCHLQTSPLIFLSMHAMSRTLLILKSRHAPPRANNIVGAMSNFDAVMRLCPPFLASVGK